MFFVIQRKSEGKMTEEFVCPRCGKYVKEEDISRHKAECQV